MKLPKITIEKNYTTIAQVDRVKADIQEFRERYTCGDLFCAFQRATGYYDATCEEIATVEIQAFPGGRDWDDATRFCVQMLTVGQKKIHRFRFYVGLDLDVDTGDLVSYDGADHGKLYNIEEFRLAELVGYSAGMRDLLLG